jgi:hypothetical protein
MRKEILEKMINLKRNNIIIGDMSTGKTTNIGFGIVKKLIEKNENLFILDTKEEYLNKYYDILKRNNYNILIINTKNPKYSNGWNPLKYSNELFNKGFIDESIKYLNNMAEELFYEYSITDPFWSNMSNDFFKGLALSLYNDAKKEEINFRSISSLILDANLDINYLAEYFRTKDKTDSSYICSAPTIFSPLETRGGIISTAMSKLNSLVRNENLSLLLNDTSYDYSDLLKNKTAIFFIANEIDDLNALARIYIKELFNILCDNNNQNKFNIILDNFDYLNNVINLNNMLSSAINHNIKFYIFTRDKERLEKLYSNYINKLSNKIILHDKKILVKIGDEEKEIPNVQIKEETTKSIIDYPKLKDCEIKIFNLKKYIINNISINNGEYENYKLELSNIETYEKIKGKNDNPQKLAIKNNEAKFYVIKNEDKIVDNFVIFNDENWLAIENKKLLDIDYINFIFDNLKDYKYLTVIVPSTAEHIINVLRINFDIKKEENLTQNEVPFKKIVINI